MSKPKHNLTEFGIQNALCSRIFNGSHHICPNYTPLNWWECDIFAITDAGMFVEYEIKICAADFYQDAKKDRKKIHPCGTRAWLEKEYKHDLLKARDKRGPSRFYYVLPEGVVDSSEVPEWAGIMRASMIGPRVCIGYERKAPRLHKEMVAAHIVHHVSKVFYYRFWNERRKDRGNSVTFEPLKEDAQ